MASRIIPGISDTMTQCEKSILRSFKTEICDSVDPVTLVSFLFRHGNVSKELKERVMFLFRTGSSRHDIMGIVLDFLPEVINISILVYAFDRTGYKDIATEIFLVARQAFHGADIYQRSSSSAERTRIQTLYRNLKRMIHDSMFKNPRKALRSMVKRFRSDFEVERDELKRQTLADKCVAILAVELDAHYDSLGCKVEITPEEMLMEMKELIPNTTNPLITDAIVYSSQANLDAFHGDFSKADNMLIAARSSAQGVEQCLELVNHLYVEVYVKLWKFELSPSKENIDTLMMWGRFGLGCLNNEHEETRRLWKRMFILRMVFGLLGLGNRGNIIQGYSVDRASIREAQDLLAEVDKIWDRIEVRREMFYCIARSRLNELLGLFDTAKGYLERAKALAVQGGFLEKLSYIDNFMTCLNNRLGQTFSGQFASSLTINTVNRDTQHRDRPVKNTISKVMGDKESTNNPMAVEHLRGNLIYKRNPCSGFGNSEADDDIRSHNHRVRQVQTLIKGNKVREEQNQEIIMPLLTDKNESDMAEPNCEEEAIGSSGLEDAKETFHKQNQNNYPTKHEIIAQESDIENLVERFAAVLSTSIELVSSAQNNYMTPDKSDINSMADTEFSRLNSDKAHQFQALIKKKTFTGGSDHDIAMRDIRDPDATDVKETVEDYQSSDTTDLKKCKSELERSSKTLHSNSSNLGIEKSHIQEENTLPKPVADSFPVYSAGVDKSLWDENVTTEDITNKRVNDIKLQLTIACEEKIEFGSVALYEDRLEPEGASFTGQK